MLLSKRWNGKKKKMGKSVATRTALVFPSFLCPQGFSHVLVIEWLFLPYRGSECHFLKAAALQLSFTRPRKEKNPQFLAFGPSIGHLNVKPYWNGPQAKSPWFLAEAVESVGEHQLPGASAASLQSVCIHLYQTRQRGIDLTCTLEVEDGKILMFHCLHV